MSIPSPLSYKIGPLNVRYPNIFTEFFLDLLVTHILNIRSKMSRLLPNVSGLIFRINKEYQGVKNFTR